MASAERSRFLLLAALFGALGAGCTSVTSTCNHDADPTVTTVPFTADKLDGDTYHSSSWEGPFEFFPPAKTLVFEHGLGRTPWHIDLLLAFQPNGTLAPSAGNMAVFPTKTSPPDENTITVYNDTCSTFYLFVVASP